MNELKIPVEWIDRIFQRLTEAYGARFASKFIKASYIEIARTQWQSGLIGVTQEEIRKVLEMCRQGLIREPPTVMDFFHLCKGAKLPSPSPKPERSETSQQIGSEYLKLIMDKLHGRLTSEGRTTLSALDKQILEKSKLP